MHKLRLRAKSSSSAGRSSEDGGADSKDGVDGTKKKKLRAGSGAASNAGGGLARKSSKRGGQQQQPRLLLEDNSFRTSLILPHLTKRFALLRAEDGSLVSLLEMQRHLRVQRDNGRLTESEERMVMQEYRLQSMYEARRPNGSAATYPLDTLQEESGSIDERQSQGLSIHGGAASMSSGQSSSDDARSSGYRSPYTPNSSQIHQYHGPASSWLGASLPASVASAPISPSGYASSSTAEFYAARDAVLRGNGLFGGGGLERDVLSKMTKSPSSQGSTNVDGVFPTSTSEPGTPSKTRQRRFTSSGNSSPYSDDGQFATTSNTRMEARIPPVPKIQYKREEEEEYDPYRPRDSDDIRDGPKSRSQAGHPSYLDVDQPMSRKQFNRISRVLEDIEAELTKTHHRIRSVDEDGEEELFNNSNQQDYTEEEDVDHEDRLQADNSNNSGYSNGMPYSDNGYDERDRLYHSSSSAISATSSDHRHHQKAFVYDDTEEIDPPLSRLPSQQEFDLSQSSPRIEYPDEVNEGEAQYRISSSSHSSLAATELGVASSSHRPTGSTSTLQIATEENQQDRLSAHSSPGLGYLQATPPPPIQASTFPNSDSMQSMASNTSSNRGPPPISAVQPNFGHIPYPASMTQQQHYRQNSHVKGTSKKTPTHSRANSTASSLNPPLSPPPNYGLPPLPDSSSTGSIGSLMMMQLPSQQQQQPQQVPDVPHSVSIPTLSSNDSNASSLSKISQSIPSNTTTTSKNASARPPSFSSFSFPHSTGSIPASAGSNFSLQKYLHEPDQASPRSSSTFERFGGSRNAQEGEIDDTEGEESRGKIARNVRPESTLSTGSSWRGGGLPDSSYDSNFDLSRLSMASSSAPTSPSKSQAIRKMEEIAEEGSNRNSSTSLAENGISQQEEEIRRFLQSNETNGLNMQDLRMIQQKLVDGAMSRAASQTEHNREGKPAERELSAKSPDGTPSAVDDVEDRHLGSPFFNQEPEAGDISIASQTSAPTDFEPKSPAAAVPALNALRGRASPGHPSSRPNSRPSSPFQQRAQNMLQRKESASSMRKTQMSPARLLQETPTQNSSGQNDYFNLQKLQDERAEARDNMQLSPKSDGEAISPKAAVPLASPNGFVSPTTLRPKQTRASNSTPSMLIRHVQQQASEATAALKQPGMASPNHFSPESTGAPTPRRTLSHRKSVKNIKISGPQLVSASANLDNMPSIDTIKQSPQNTSPELGRNQSSAGMKFKMRFRGGKKETEDAFESHADELAASPLSRSQATNGSLESRPSTETRQPDAHAGIRQLMSKFKKRKPSEVLASPRLLPDPLVLDSPSLSSQMGEPKSPAFFNNSPAIDAQSPNSQYASPPAGYTPSGGPRANIISTSSNDTDPMIDTSPLAITPKGSPVASKHSAERSIQARLDNEGGKEVDRASAASLDSMRKLLEAATALGLDSDRVNELIDAAGYNSKTSATLSSPHNRLVRSSVILPPPNTSNVDFPMTPPQQRQMDSRMKRVPSSASSMKRSQSGRDRAPSMSNNTTADSSFSPSNPPNLRQRALSASTSGGGTRRSVHDRPPTPPPTKAMHRRQRSDALTAENPLPASPPTPQQQWSSPITHPSFTTSSAPMAYAKSSSSGTTSASDQLGLPLAPFMRNGGASVVSARSFGSYDAKSIYGLYGDEDEDVPPTPSLHEMDMVLASGRIPGTSNDTSRASLSLAPGMTAKRLSKASRNSRIELSEYANGDIAFNIIQSLRGPGSGSMSAPGNRDTFFPVDSHRRQASETTLEEEILASQSASSPTRAPLDADPLRLLVKRNQKMRREQEEAEAARMIGRRREDRTHSADSLNSSQRSVLEVYEAADEAQVAALIEELTRGLDEGQFNLSRTGTLSNSHFKPKTTPQVSESALSTPTKSPSNGLTRTPSKVKRQPAPSS